MIGADEDQVVEFISDWGWCVVGAESGEIYGSEYDSIEEALQAFPMAYYDNP